jgi:hypothetical protein
MAIYRIFKERPFDPEAIVRLSAAYEYALKALRVVDRQRSMQHGSRAAEC